MPFIGGGHCKGGRFERPLCTLYWTFGVLCSLLIVIRFRCVCLSDYLSGSVFRLLLSALHNVT